MLGSTMNEPSLITFEQFAGIVFGMLVIAVICLGLYYQRNARGSLDPAVRALYDQPPLHRLMTGRSSRDSVVALLDGGSDVNQRSAMGWTPLTLLMSNLSPVSDGSRNHEDIEEIARLLLERGADPNAELENGMTALRLAQRQDATGIERLLVEHGASPQPPPLRSISMPELLQMQRPGTASGQDPEACGRKHQLVGSRCSNGG